MAINTRVTETGMLYIDSDRGRKFHVVFDQDGELVEASCDPAGDHIAHVGNKPAKPCKSCGKSKRRTNTDYVGNPNPNDDPIGNQPCCDPVV